MKRTLKTARTLLALAAALALLLGSALPVPAARADDYDQPIEVDNGTVSPAEAPVKDGVLDGDLAVSGDGDLTALTAESDAAATPSGITVTGDVEAVAETKDAIAVRASAENGGSAEVTVGGSVEATTLQDDVDEGSSSSWPEALAVSVSARGNGSSAVATVHGDVTASAEGTTANYCVAVGAYAEKGGTAEVTVDGRAAAANAGEYTPYAHGVSIFATGDGSSAAVSVGEGVEGHADVETRYGGTAELTVESGGVSDGVYITNGVWYMEWAEEHDYPGGTVTAEITGDIGKGVDSSAYSSGGKQVVTDLTITGNVTDQSDSYACAIDLEAEGEGTENNLVLRGNASAECGDGYAIGLGTDVYDGGRVTAAITGDITAESADEDSGALGIAVDNWGGSAEITVEKGSITVTGTGGKDAGIRVETIGNYTAEKTGEGETFAEGAEKPRATENFVDVAAVPVPYDRRLYILGEGGDKAYYILGDDGKYYPLEGVTPVQPGSTRVTLEEGDVSGTGYGVSLNVAEEQEADILVNGTVGGDQGSLVLVNDTELGSGVTFTVWELKKDGNGAVAYTCETGDESGADTLTENKEAEAQIQYIIRVKADQQDIITAAGDAFDYRGYKVAHENDTVTLKLDIPEGYEITAAFGDVDQSVKLEKNAKGEYFLTVPRGGAVELSVTLGKLPEPEPEEEETAPDTVMITYVLDNDTQYDHVRTTAGVGEKISLQAAPEREGYTFLYWKGSDVDINSPYYKEPNPDTDFQFHPGATYNVRRAYNFIAVWKKN